jgi:hypothetical protein
MDAQIQKQGQMLAVVLGTIALLLGIGLVLWSLARGNGLHGTGLISGAVGLVVISIARRRSRIPRSVSRLSE